MGLHLRNIETGAIKVVEPDSDEFAKLRDERTEDGRFPLYEQTSAGDADPENHAAAEEVDARQRHGRGLPLHDVTSDGSPQSRKSRDKLEEDAADGEERSSSRRQKAPAKS